jgi:hypothetical protein
VRAGEFMTLDLSEVIISRFQKIEQGDLITLKGWNSIFEVCSETTTGEYRVKIHNPRMRVQGSEFTAARQLVEGRVDKHSEIRRILLTMGTGLRITYNGFWRLEVNEEVARGYMWNVLEDDSFLK